MPILVLRNVFQFVLVLFLVLPPFTLPVLSTRNWKNSSLDSNLKDFYFPLNDPTRLGLFVNIWMLLAAEAEGLDGLFLPDNLELWSERELRLDTYMFFGPKGEEFLFYIWLFSNL